MFKILVVSSKNAISKVKREVVLMEKIEWIHVVEKDFQHYIVLISQEDITLIGFKDLELIWKEPIPLASNICKLLKEENRSEAGFEKK